MADCAMADILSTISVFIRETAFPAKTKTNCFCLSFSCVLCFLATLGRENFFYEERDKERRSKRL